MSYFSEFFKGQDVQKDILAYADVILYLVAVDKGDTVSITCDFDHEPLVYALTQKAYQKGAKYVTVRLRSDTVDTYRACYSDEKYFDYFLESDIAFMKECCDNKTCVISIRSPSDPQLNKNVSSDALATIHKVIREKSDMFHKAIISDALSWIVTAFPTLGWVKNVYPDLDTKEGMQKLWAIVKKVLRLDTADPVKAWQQQQSLLLARRKYLNDKKYTGLHLVGEGTDLYVGLHDKSTWLGGKHMSQNGKIFQANIPTEEVYTSPDCRFTKGCVKVQRPITIFGKTVDGIEINFDKGKVESVSATKNKDVLLKYLDAQDRNRYLGEIALVDINSLVWQSKLMFNSILYDENAGVHFALGTAYTSGYGYSAKDTIPEPQELIKMGCNSSSFHMDFTVGYEGLDVYGVYQNEQEQVTEEAIMQKGEFVPKELQSQKQ